MDSQKRLILFFLSSMAVLFIWQRLIVPRIVPPPAQAEADKAALDKPAADKPAEGAKDGEEKKRPAVQKAPDKPPREGDEGEKPAEPLPYVEPARRTVSLGSLDPDSRYRMLVRLNSRGASIDSIILNDPQYRDQETGEPLELLSSATLTLDDPRTFDARIAAVDAALARYAGKPTCAGSSWEVIPDSEGPSAVAFRLRVPDGSWEVEKHYTLGERPDDPGANEAPAYVLEMELVIRNAGRQPQSVDYELQGPVGVVLEGLDYTRKFRDVATGLIQPGGGLLARITSSAAIAKNVRNQKAEPWVLPIRYVGIDVQYFAALVIPDANQEKEPQFRHVTAAVVGPDRAEKSNTSVVLTSKEFELEAGDELRHRLKLFAGPKRKTFLAAYGAEDVNAYWSWSLAFLGIPQAMGWLLDTFAGLLPKWAWPYGWAIILLTVVVRVLLFPLSKKQVMTAIKMQELQPQIQELKRKYGNDNQKFAQAQLELYRKHNFNPLGCGLVLIIQLPILIALYSTLSMSLDLRLARFLWIDNLAAPDALFTFPFHLPWIGNKFNLLPIITTLLFYLQQKLFTPPPTDPEQAAQQKMMSVMSILISLMFYHMPSGLCLYFIASTLWGLAERQVLPKANRPQAVQEADRGGRREPAAAGRGSAKSKR